MRPLGSSRRAATKSPEGAEPTKAWPRKTQETQKSTKAFLPAKNAKRRERFELKLAAAPARQRIGPLTSDLLPQAFRPPRKTRETQKRTKAFLTAKGAK
jgi:hypothetical protein